jgi:MFS family permease
LRGRARVRRRAQRTGGPTIDAWAALRFPQYRLLWISGFVVFLAVTAQGIARGWLARRLTGTNAGLGGVMLGFGLPMLFATPWGGVAADRISKRAILFTSMLMLTGSAAWIGLAVAFDVIEYWMLIGASAIQAVAFALYGPARMAFIAELVDRPTFTNAVTLGQMSAEGTRVLGPALAGVLIGSATFGTEGVFLLGALLCGGATISAFWLPPGRPPPGRPARSPLGEMADGVRYVRGEKGLALLVLTSLGVVMIGFPYMAFLPTVADEIFDVGSGGYGLMSAVSAMGAVAAGVFTARRSAALDPWRGLAISGTALGVAIIGLGIAPVYAVALAVLPVIGAAGLAFQTTNQSLLLNLSEFEYHGRIQGLIMLGFSGFGIAALPLGVLADRVGLRPTLVGMGLTVIGCIALFDLRRRRYATLEVSRDLG